MENSNNDETPTMDSIRAIFGPPPPRRPIPSNSFNTLVKIFSLFPDQNPFSDYASNANLSEYSRLNSGTQNDVKKPNSGDGHVDSVVARGGNKASGEFIDPAMAASEDFCDFSLPNETNNDMSREEICINDSSSGLDMVMDEPCMMRNNTETINKMASDDKCTDAQMEKVEKVPEALSGIERILMDDSDEMGLLGLQENDSNSTFLTDFGSILDTDVCIDNTVAVERSLTRKLSIDKNVKENVAGEVKGKDVEVNKPIPGIHVPDFQPPCLVDTEITSKEKFKDREKKLCKEKDINKLLEREGLTSTAQKSKGGGGVVTIGSSVDRVGKENIIDAASKEKNQTNRKASAKDVKSGKRKHISPTGDVLNSTSSGSVNPSSHENIVKQYARRNTGKSAKTKAQKSQPKCSKGFRYTREQLLGLRNGSVENCALKTMTASISEDILKALHEIGADLHDKGQNSSAQKTIDISVGNQEKIGSPREAKLTKDIEMDSNILKNKKRGSSSEARKEKKKRLKRKKRAELNKKLGVKRLKLRPPVLKPKVVPDCRHYLHGRCELGEKCNFSHDLIPLTKSKPCCHFARNACMKGDDCPFDHQLSKYPCKNFLDTGFCIRGDSCSFSHKMSSTEGSIPVSGASKSDNKSALHLEGSNSKNQINSGILTPNSHKVESARQMSQPAIAPKGLNFLSFGKSSVENPTKHKEVEQFQQSSDAAAGTCSANIATGAASKINNDGSGRGSQLKQNISSKPASVCQMFKGNLAPISPEAIDLSFYSGPSHVLSSGGKSQTTVPTSEHSDRQFGEKGTADATNKLKAVAQPGSPSSSGQYSTKAGARSSSGTANKVLLSTLAFAAKFESGIKMSSMAPSKELSKNGGTTNDSGCRNNEESKASAILEFLYSGSNKERQ